MNDTETFQSPFINIYIVLLHGDEFTSFSMFLLNKLSLFLKSLKNIFNLELFQVSTY